MTLIRFMGKEELKKYLRGELLENFTDWEGAGRRSGSIGFCFFDDSENPVDRMHYLTGIVDLKYCVEFSPVGPMEFRKNYGTYAIPDNAMHGTFAEFLNSIFDRKRQLVMEYSTTHYNLQSMELVRVGIPDITGKEGYQIHWLSDDDISKIREETSTDENKA